MGLEPILIGSRPYSEMVGCISFPTFMFGNKLTEANKIIEFNHFVKNIEIEESPDLIIIGIPGGILPYNNSIHSNFGITAFEVAQSISPDYCILSLFYNSYSKVYIKQMEDLFSARFNSNLDMINITNKRIDEGEMANRPNDIRTFTINHDDLIKKVQYIQNISGKTIVSLNEKSKENEIVNHIIDVLSNYESEVFF